MGYSKRTANSAPLPGSSIKGAGALPPGTYKGYFEKKRTAEGTQIWFVSMPAGLHILEEAAEVEEGREYTVQIALTPAGIIARTDGGRFYVAHAHTKEALTSQHADVHAALLEAAEKKLKLAQPVVVLIKDGENVLYKRDVTA